MRYINYLNKVIFTLILIALFTHPITAKAAEAPYTTLTIDKDGWYINTQDGYIPTAVYDK